MNKVWKNISEIKGFESYNGYSISNYGDVKSNKRSKEIILAKRRKFGVRDDIHYRLYDNLGNSKNFLASRLVALAFIPNPKNKPQVNHINGDYLYNFYKNLEWVTHKENMEHAAINGLMGRQYKPVYADRGGKGLKFDSLKSASEWFNVDQSHISKTISRGGRCKGYTINFI